MNELLSARGLTFAYDDRPVLKDVSVALSAGQVIALHGPNGSGKSTLIRLLLGHLRGGSGTIRWLGKDLRSWRCRELARRVAYLPQWPSFDPLQRVGEVLRLGRAPYWRTFGIESARDFDIVATVAHMLELDDLLTRPMDRLSGGQRQRVFIGRCLVQEPIALLLDEPGTFLDLKHQIELGLLLKKLAGQQELGVLMASHDLNLSAAVADHIILLKDGSIVCSGAPGEVLQAEVLSRVYDVQMQRIDRPDGKPLVYPRI